MKRLFTYIILIAVFFSCGDDDPGIEPYDFLIKPHNSNNELYVGVPVEFLIKGKGGGQKSFSKMDLFIDQEEVSLNRQRYSFDSPGTYQINANVAIDSILYKIDTLLNITIAPPIYITQSRAEKVLFSWKTDTIYNILLSTYYGNSARDYEVLSINESLQQQGTNGKISLDTYPEFYGFGASTSGRLVLGYNQQLAIYSPTLSLERRIGFNYGKSPRKILVQDDDTFLLFDSLSHIVVRSLNMNTGQLVGGETKFVGVDDMTVFNYFFLGEQRVATYYVNEDNSRSLIMASQIGGDFEFVHYFQPFVSVNGLNSISNGEFIINSYKSQENKIAIIGVDASGVVNWTRQINMDVIYNRERFDFRIRVLELNGFIYVFFDNMRCVKFSLQGALVWDKYFYATSAQFREVLATPSGEIVMLGTRQMDDPTIDYLLQTDVIAIKINADGFRVGVGE
ncbi:MULTISPECIES: hypothetical protein [unclassified Imperialibacter]|uniref:hypothetical protein n=1 Tax=unclassified Imperialibacter TaxID=2629706 RepID=UPI001253063D|nr:MULTISPECIES: hypothetical protein [unclassified Imperialibacter]CAD5277028.1 hypothetical protein IMPERIA75_420148 [Imperialibacter sp. 75]CAD5295024.1 hypothetical protein IMPERIA89_660146 [Imperialibacter sp. 89]VVT12273.1 hypothetical protein IMPR6_20141 [Imperialibacter sp. EC-SDR9]